MLIQIMVSAAALMSAVSHFVIWRHCVSCGGLFCRQSSCFLSHVVCRICLMRPIPE